MKNIEKIVPAVAMSLAVAGMGSINAFAEGEAAPGTPAPAAEPSTEPATSEVKESATPAAPSTNVDSVQPNTPETNTETGVTTTTGTVNTTTNSDGDVITDGNITLTETPTGSTEERSDPTPSGPAVVTPNPDGGSTSTTPTEVEVTETEETDVTVEGEVKPQEPVVTTPTEDETKDLDHALNEKDEDGNAKVNLSDITIRHTDEENPENSTEGTKFGGFEAVSKDSVENKEYTDETTQQSGTQTTTTVVFEKRVDVTQDKPLTTDDGTGEGFGEFGKIVNDMFGLNGVEFTKVGTNGLSYVQNGETVVVTLEEDLSTETQTTIYRIKVSQTKTVLNDKETTGNGTNLGEGDNGTIIYNPSNDDPDEIDQVINDILEAAKNNDGCKQVGDAVTSDEGKTTTVTIETDDGKSRYVITETKTGLTEEQLANVSNADLVTLLGADKVKLSTDKDGNEIVVTNDANEYVVTFVKDDLTGETVMRTIQIYDLSKVAGKEETTKPDDVMTMTPEEQAVVGAVGKAVEADGLTADDIQSTEINPAEGGGYEVKVTAKVKVKVGDTEKEVLKVFTYKVTASTVENTVKWGADKLGEEYAEGSTTTVTGEAHVSGETIVWNGTTGTDKITVTETKDEETGEVTNTTINVVGVKKDDVFNADTGEKVTDVKTEDGKTTITTEYTVVTYAEDGKTVLSTAVHTKTYTYTLGSMTDAEKAKFMQDNGLTGDGTAELTGLSKVTWTIDEHIKTTTPGGPLDPETDDSLNDQKANVGSVGAIKDLSKPNDNTYVYDGVTLTKDTAKSTESKTVYTGKSADGKTTYTIEETKVPLANIKDEDIVALIAQKYEVPAGATLTGIDRENGTATYVNGKDTITINFTGLSKTNVTLNVTTESPQFESTVSKDAVKNEIKTWVDTQVQKYGSVQVGGYTITSKMTEVEIGQIIEKLADQAINSDVDFTEITGDKLKETLDGLAQKGTSYMPSANGSTYGQWTGGGTKVQEASRYRGEARDFYGVVYIKESGKWYQAEQKTGYDHWNRPYTYYEKKAGSPAYEADDQNYINIPIPADKLGHFNTELGHIDLVADSTLTTDDGEEDCILLGDVAITLTKTSQDMANGTNLDDSAKLKDSIDWDNQDGLVDAEGKPLGFWQYDRADGLSQDYIDRDSKFYKVTGTVAYGLEHFENEWAAQNAQKAGTIIGYKAVPEVVNGVATGKTVYKGYTKTAVLTTYGYLGAENNACHNDYDIKLGNLKLLKGGEKVTSVNDKVEVFSAKVTATSTLNTAISELIFGNIVTVTTGNKPDGVEESNLAQVKKDALTGAWTITQKRTETDLQHEEGEGDEKKLVWDYSDEKGFSYDTFKKLVEQADLMGEFGSSGTRYNGSLGYTYFIPGSEHLDDIVINLEDGASTKEVSAVRNVNARLSTTTTSTRTEPGDPIIVVTPPTTTPGGDTTPGDDDTTPPPVVDVTDEEVPLVEAPEEVEVLDEEVPLVEAPEELEIPDEDVPLADVPKTGENVMVEMMAAAAAAASALWLSVMKKRKD